MADVEQGNLIARAEVSWALSLWQPWASLWLGPKVHETRGWSTRYRGLLYVHAVKQPIRKGELTEDLVALCESEFGSRFWTELPFGRRRKIAVEIGRRLDVLGLENRMCRLPGETDDAFRQRLMRGRRDR